MKPDHARVEARIAAADPARSFAIDERERRALWAIIASEPRPPRQRIGARVRTRLRKALILIPSIGIVSGAGLGAQSAWCAPCRQATHAPAFAITRPPGAFALEVVRAVSTDQLPSTRRRDRRPPA